jgi:hypothetical protein
MPRNRAGTLSLQDRFAEALADSAGTTHDGDVPLAGARLGFDMKRANSAMQNVRKSLGWQAR